VTLEDVAGTLLTTTLTDGRGGFSVPLPNDGAFVVQADRAGFRASTATVAADSVAPPVELRLARIVIPLDDLSTDMGKGCRVPARTAERVAELWNETRKALAVAALVEDQGRLGYQVETWYRHLDPRRLRVLEEDRTPHVGFRNTLRHPSPPADELAREGYVRGGRPGESLAFYPPDVHTLVSTIFPATHCLGFDGDAPEDGWVGLRFEPLDEQAMDVEGTLWIDARSYEHGQGGRWRRVQAPFRRRHHHQPVVAAHAPRRSTPSAHHPVGRAHEALYPGRHRGGRRTGLAGTHTGREHRGDTVANHDGG
jgi:hypothetical protein